jgi:alkylation response protein AidB-like acyl-CoA dehydrogenase
MDLSLSSEQQLITDSAQALLAGCCTSAQVRAAMDTPTGHDAALWQQLGEQGWCGLLTPVEWGGQGLGLTEAVLLHEALGAHLACVPCFDSAVLAGTALRAAGGPADLMAAHGRGDQIAALGFDEVAAQLDASGWHLTGNWPAVGSAHLADAWLLPVRAGDMMLLWVPRGTPGFSVAQREGVDRSRQSADVVAHSAAVAGLTCVARGPAAEQALRMALLHGAIALAAEQLGVAAHCLQMSCAYVTQREQFGRPVASFQAVKHRCAQMLVAVESARSAVWGAACVADASPSLDGLEFAAAQALCTAHDAAAFAAQEAIQLHGGTGYTWACDAHLYLRRAQNNRQRLGPPSVWLERVAAQLLDRVGDERAA